MCCLSCLLESSIALNYVQFLNCKRFPSASFARFPSKCCCWRSQSFTVHQLFMILYIRYSQLWQNYSIYFRHLSQFKDVKCLNDSLCLQVSSSKVNFIHLSETVPYFQLKQVQFRFLSTDLLTLLSYKETFTIVDIFPRHAFLDPVLSQLSLLWPSSINCSYLKK